MVSTLGHRFCEKFQILFSVGDFVIEINGVNVQHERTMNNFGGICANNKGILELKIKKRTKPEIIEITGARELHQDWGMSLAVVIKDIMADSYAKSLKMREGDEIIQVSV